MQSILERQGVWAESQKFVLFPTLWKLQHPAWGLYPVKAVIVLLTGMCKGEELSLLWGFADLCLSAQWFPPVITSKVEMITTFIAIRDDLFLAEFSET